MRGYNITGNPVAVTLRPWRPFVTAVRCNLAEEPLNPLTVEEDGTVHLQAGGHEIVTVRFSLSQNYSQTSRIINLVHYTGCLEPINRPYQAVYVNIIPQKAEITIDQIPYPISRKRS